MKIIKGSIKEDFDRELYWTKLVFLSDDEAKKTQVLACASQEYLKNLYKLSGSQRLNQEHFGKWRGEVTDKWSGLGEKLFEKDAHYDVYANTKKGEANGIDYLLTKCN